MSCVEMSTAIRCSLAISRQQIDHLLLTADVEVGERFVEEEQAWMADQRMGDEDPLLLTTRQVADTQLGKTHGVDGLEHVVDLPATRRRRERQTKSLPVDTETDKVACSQRHVRVERDPLRYVADRAVDVRSRLHAHRAGARGDEPEDDPQQRCLAGAVGADQAGELTGIDMEGDVAKDLATGQRHADAVDRENFVRTAGGMSLHGYRLCVETPCTTAFCNAVTSASIHD